MFRNAEMQVQLALIVVCYICFSSDTSTHIFERH